MADENVTTPFTPPSLPRGGGAVSGSAGALNAGGPDGTAGYSIPLPSAQIRSVAPAVALSYSSAGGSSPFGLGWQCGLPAFRRETRFGTPIYTEQDAFTGPDGEVLRATGEERTATLLAGMSVGEHHVVRYRSALDDPSTRTERWTSSESGETFWLQYAADGSLTLYGWSTSARLSAPGDTHAVAEWMIEETVTATGEHVLYRWRDEDDARCTEEELSAHPSVSGKYPDEICWGNVAPADHFLVTVSVPPPETWLCSLRFDYGERLPRSAARPEGGFTTPWRLRHDCFSRYHYGFDVRTRRLCRKVLLFQRTGLLSGTGDATPEYISGIELSYDESPVVSVLTACRQISYESDGTPVSLPPLEFEMARSAHASVQGWQPVRELDGFFPPVWQFADLYGEGIPGILWQDNGAWWYREPLAAPGGEVTWGDSRPLPAAPGGTGMLADPDSDGRPDWLISAPGMHGYFTLSPDRSWRHFIPLDAVPVEFRHPGARLADLTGAGLQDLVMIGPRSVRLWPSAAGKGWQTARDVPQADGVTLPVFDRDERRLVAFSDMLGAGQLQLTEITAEGVICWPGLGRGRFAPPVTLSGFSVPAGEFSPRRVYLADLDGSGCSDIIVLGSREIRVFINQSGNGFVAAPSVPLPEGLMADDTCTLQVADIHGLGVSTLVFTVPHMAPRSWSYSFTAHKPWLLSEICNNMGALTRLVWQSSARSWLEEKEELRAAGHAPVSYLPFPVHLLSRVYSQDEITGVTLVSSTRYRKGVWDGKQREFRGFCFTEQTDTHEDARGTDGALTPPARVKSWFLSGIAERDAELAADFYPAEPAYPAGPVRFTQRDINGHDIPLEPDEKSLYWLFRALKGRPLRQEVYGDDGSALEAVPYSVSHSRWQVRATWTQQAGEPVALVIPLETLSWQCERIQNDPVISQSITLDVDAYGSVTRAVTVNYPRTGRATAADYPVNLPEGLFDAARDDQQFITWLSLSRASWHHITEPENGIWLCGLPDASCEDVLSLPADAVPAKGFSFEYLSADDSPLNDSDALTLKGQQKTWWCAGAPDAPLDVPVRPPLPAFTETAEFDDAALAAFDGVLSDEQLQELLRKGGYVTAPRLYDPKGEELWVRRNGFTYYGDAASFWQPDGGRDSLLTGITRVERDALHCVVTQVTDAAGLTTKASYDWRFLTPFLITDVNDNQQMAAFDAFGRLSSSRFWGTENGEPAGYSPDASFAPPASVDVALALKGIPVASCHVTVADSWMPRSPDDGTRCGMLALRRRYPEGVPKEWLAERNPPYVISLQTDRYDTDPAQQVRLQVVHCDGFGRVLQTAVLNPPGDALVRTPDGALATGEDGAPLTQHVDIRWAVSGRTEYDNKGQAVRNWFPFYLNDWRWVENDTARNNLYADTTFYDPTGRPYRILTAAGWERRTQYFPWFTVAEDENDTAADVLSRRDASAH